MSQNKKLGIAFSNKDYPPNKLINLISIFIKNKKIEKQSIFYLIPILVLAPLLLVFGIYAFFSGIEIPEDSL